MSFPFHPTGTVSQAAAATAADVKLAPFAVKIGTVVRVAVIGVGDVLIAFASSPGGAVANMPVVSERPDIFMVPPNTTSVQIKAISGTPTVYLTSGHLSP